MNDAAADAVPKAEVRSQQQRTPLRDTQTQHTPPSRQPQPVPKRTLPRGVVRACSGVLESVDAEPYATYARAAEDAISCVRGGSERQRAMLADAIRLNLINRKEYPYEVLARRFGLPVSCSTFKREKMRYLRRFAELCGFI